MTTQRLQDQYDLQVARDRLKEIIWEIQRYELTNPSMSASWKRAAKPVQQRIDRLGRELGES